MRSDRTVGQRGQAMVEYLLAVLLVAVSMFGISLIFKDQIDRYLSILLILIQFPS
jgi:Tfp pilus assembly protein PilV